MELLTPILITIFLSSLLFNYISLNLKKSAMEIVNQMGLGYNLGNSFDCIDNSVKIENPNDIITLCGNPIPTKNTIIALKKYGFKTIRFPITWFYFMDELGKV